MDFKESDIVFVTGGNGHVAQHIIQQLLAMRNGPRVRTSVRSDSSAVKLSTAFAAGVSLKKLEIIQIPDMTATDAFAYGLSGVTHLAHIASPLIIGAKDIEHELLKPAIRGTTEILKTALRVPTLKSVVVTSSFASVWDPGHGQRPGYVYSPADWNPTTYAQAADPNLDLTQWEPRWRHFITYCASKKLAEKAAWDLWEAAKPSWGLSTICPTYIGGPCVLDISAVEDLSFSNGLLWTAASGGGGGRLPEMDFPHWIDVRDVAGAHVRALVTEKARGKRFILAENERGHTFSEFAKLSRKNFPNLKPSEEEEQENNNFLIDPANTSVLELKPYITAETMLIDLVKQMMAVKEMRFSF